MQDENHSDFNFSFPLIEICALAEKESWRKEINRPVYHIHKWWATRLGSVFRCMLIKSTNPDKITDIDSFYKNHKMKDKIIFDPFMGSGTTIGEAIKLGIKPIGCDINPISTFLVRQELKRVDLKNLLNAYNLIDSKISERISTYYKIFDPKTNEKIPVLYFFWVKIVTTPSGEKIPLFTKYVFSQNAYPRKKPMAHILCPKCWNLIEGEYNTSKSSCEKCNNTFNPQIGPSNGSKVTDSKGKEYKIIDLIPENKRLPEKMYAALAVRPSGEKVYLPIDASCIELYDTAKKDLMELEKFLPLPSMKIRSGHNTNQIKKYNYTHWRHLFNERQLLCLGLLLKEILNINDRDIQGQLLCLFSSTLEFNNMFCSFKGEGTGAVRPIFSNHILKPEKTSLENSIWGTKYSSGCFSTLYWTRLMKAKEYLDFPFEIKIENSHTKKILCSDPINVNILQDWKDFSADPKGVLILNGDSSATKIPPNSVDAVVTDPPYFDYINYSELSDFFYSWLSPILKDVYAEFIAEDSSRENEVQSRNPHLFTSMLSNVFTECNRVMKEDALLSFTFHHSKPEGWSAISSALINSGFVLSCVFPIHGELRASTAKSSTKEPISLDAILICKKYSSHNEPPDVEKIIYETFKCSSQLIEAGMTLSKTDYTVISSSLSLMYTTSKKLDYCQSKNFISDISKRVLEKLIDNNSIE